MVTDGTWRPKTSRGIRLIASDRLSATNNRADLREAPVSQFKDHVESILSVPILTLMVAFESSLDIPLDGIRFDEGEDFGSLGWIARDTSKPGRERADGQECWVVQSGPKAAQQVLDSIAQDDPNISFEAKRELVREKSKEILLKDFMDAIPKLVGAKDIDIPRTTTVIGHRWSAAFPSVPKETTETVGECLKHTEQSFVACGDYMGTFTGRVEGAYLSGEAAANAILNSLKPQE